MAAQLVHDQADDLHAGLGGELGFAVDAAGELAGRQHVAAGAGDDDERERGAEAEAEDEAEDQAGDVDDELLEDDLHEAAEGVDGVAEDALVEVARRMAVVEAQAELLKMPEAAHAKLEDDRLLDAEDVAHGAVPEDHARKLGGEKNARGIDGQAQAVVADGGVDDVLGKERHEGDGEADEGHEDGGQEAAPPVGAEEGPEASEHFGAAVVADLQRDLVAVALRCGGWWPW